MNTNDVLTKLIAEIRKHLIPTILDRDYDEWEKGKDAGLQQAIDIAESLQQEQPKVELELEKEIDKFLNETGAPYVWCNDDEQKEWCNIIARHFWNKGYNARKEE